MLDQTTTINCTIEKINQLKAQTSKEISEESLFQIITTIITKNKELSHIHQNLKSHSLSDDLIQNLETHILDNLIHIAKTFYSFHQRSKATNIIVTNNYFYEFLSYLNKINTIFTYLKENNKLIKEEHQKDYDDLILLSSNNFDEFYLKLFEENNILIKIEKFLPEELKKHIKKLIKNHKLLNNLNPFEHKKFLYIKAIALNASYLALLLYEFENMKVENKPNLDELILEKSNIIHTACYYSELSISLATTFLKKEEKFIRENEKDELSKFIESETQSSLLYSYLSFYEEDELRRLITRCNIFSSVLTKDAILEEILSQREKNSVKARIITKYFLIKEIEKNIKKYYAKLTQFIGFYKKSIESIELITFLIDYYKYQNKSIKNLLRLVNYFFDEQIKEFVSDSRYESVNQYIMTTIISLIYDFIKNYFIYLNYLIEYNLLGIINNLHKIFYPFLGTLKICASTLKEVDFTALIDLKLAEYQNKINSLGKNKSNEFQASQKSLSRKDKKNQKKYQKKKMKN